MARKMSSDRDINIPLDLTLEILKRLPTKSLARFQCVSKQWISIIKDSIVINSIVTRSLNQPQQCDPHFIFNQLSISSKICSFVLSYAYPHQITSKEQLYCNEVFGKLRRYGTRFQYIRGLIGFLSSYYDRFTIYNPTTKQYVFLADHTHLPTIMFYLFGYDPLKNQYKVVCLAKDKTHPLRCQVFTLGDPKREWRDIQCGIGCHYPFGNVICINGEIYYKARTANVSYVLVSFHVRSTKFKVTPNSRPIKSEHSTLLNYQGKLACICSNSKSKDVDLWVMENNNDEKQEWFKITFFDLFQGLPGGFRFADVTNPGGEIVLVQQSILILDNKFDVYYYDPQRNSRRKVEIQITHLSESLSPGGFAAIWAVMDHVENIMMKRKLLGIELEIR